MAELVDSLRQALGTAHVITEPSRMGPYLRERRERFVARAVAVVRPADCAQVAAAVKLCADHGTAVVPQGGNTGTVGGGIPDASGTGVVLSLERLDRIRAIDAAGYTMTVEAGCTLADVQRAAAGADRLFPLSYAAEEHCRIGGNLATNAGGMNVLRYGTARDLTLGLEVVLADGSVWHGLRAVRKDNSGYHLPGLFVGSEGTLGIITAAVLRLFPRPRAGVTLFAGLPAPEAGLVLLEALRDRCGEQVTACELMARLPVALAAADGCGEPLDAEHPWYLVADVDSADVDAALARNAASALDAAGSPECRIARAADERRALWCWRLAIPDAQRRAGASIKHDVSVPVSAVPELLRRADAAIADWLPGARPCPFGHLGDGNIHYNVTRPADADDDAFLERWEECNRVVHDVVLALGGSVAAEHGIGQLKPGELLRVKDPVELALMRRIKWALDPGNVLNPGKVIAPEH